jgi:hypothetical protein
VRGGGTKKRKTLLAGVKAVEIKFESSYLRLGSKKKEKEKAREE